MTITLFPITGQIDDGAEVYCCLPLISGTFTDTSQIYYLTWNGSDIVATLPVSVSPTLSFGSNTTLILFKYSKVKNSKATFSTTISGSTQYLGQFKSTPEIGSITGLSKSSSVYLTQGLQGLWSGYFNTFPVDNNNLMNFVIPSTTNELQYNITFIPTTIYDKTSCKGLDNSNGNYLAPYIVNFEKSQSNSSNFPAFFASLTTCNDKFTPVYCQSRETLFFGGCGAPKNNKYPNCMGRCPGWITNVTNNSDVCDIGNIADTYICEKPDSGGSDNGGGGGGGSGGKALYKQNWFIAMMVIIAVLVIIVIIVLVFRSGKKKS